MMNELQDMAVFNQVIESGSFSKAAEQLRIAKSSVSKRIQALEQRLNVILIQRSTRQLTVTDEGWSLYKHSQKIVEELRLAKETASHFQDTPQGQLRITVPPLFGRSQIAPLVPEFQRQYPDVSVELLLTEQYSEIIAEGYDLSLRMGELPDSALVAQKLCDIRVICCAAPGYLQRHGTPNQLSDLTGHRCIIWRPDKKSLLDTWTMRLRGQTEKVHVSANTVVNDHSAIIAMTVRDGGISVLPSYAIQQELTDGSLIQILPQYEIINYPISILYPQRERVPAKTRAFVAFLKQNMGSMS